MAIVEPHNQTLQLSTQLLPFARSIWNVRFLQIPLFTLMLVQS